MFELSFSEGEYYTLNSYKELLDFINEVIADWNSFRSDQLLHFKIIKIPTENSLGIDVNEEVQTADVFGGAPPKPEGMTDEEYVEALKRLYQGRS